MTQSNHRVVRAARSTTSHTARVESSESATTVWEVDPGLWVRVALPLVGGTTLGGGLVVALALTVPPVGVALAVAATATALGLTAGAAGQSQDQARQAPAQVRAVRLALEAGPAHRSIPGGGER